MDNKAHWLQVSLSVDGELAEAVSEVLSRFISNGVVVETDMKYNDAEDIGTPIGPVRVYGYLSIDEDIEETRQHLEEALWHLSQISPLPEPTYETIQDQDWMVSWKEHYHPIPIGEKLLVLPAWIEQQDHSRVAVRIDPSMAFGTGTHPSTQLCLEMVEHHTPQNQPVIDVGCGSGILSIATVKLGASHVLAVDVDRGSIMATRENATANEVIDSIEIGLGSVQEILEDSYSIQQAPLVLVNILAPIILRLFDAGLDKLVSPGGTLVLAGILEEQADNIIKTANKYNFKLIEKRQIADWVSMAFCR